MRKNRLIHITVVLAISLSLGACSRGQEDLPDTAVQVDESDVVTLDDLTAREGAPEPSEEFTVPGRAFVEVDSPRYAAVRLITGQARPLAEVGLLDLATGEYRTVVPRAERFDEGFEIVDARASDNRLVWVESNALSGEWAVYSSDLTGMQRSAAVSLSQGDRSTQIPSIAVSDLTAVWLVVPNDAADDAPEESVLHVQDGEGSPRELLRTKAQVRLPVRVCGGIVTVVERVSTGGTRRSELSAIDVSTGEVGAKLILPAPIAPSDAIYIEGTFCFAVPARYDNSGPLGQVGTYVQTGESTFLRFVRQPLDTVAKVGTSLVVKDGKSIVRVDLSSNEYVRIAAHSASPDYGDYLAVNGASPRIVTFTHIPSPGSERGSTVVRVY